MDFNEIEELYIKRVDQWAERNKQWLQDRNWEFTPHARKICASALMTRDKIESYPGHFVSAIVSNKLRETFGRADTECNRCLNALLLAYWNVETWDLVKQWDRVVNAVNEVTTDEP